MLCLISKSEGDEHVITRLVEFSSVLKQSQMRKLSVEFSKSVCKDEVKFGLLLPKWLLQNLLLWPDSNRGAKIKAFNYLCLLNLIITQIFSIWAVTFTTNVVEFTMTATFITTSMEAMIRLVILLIKSDQINSILYDYWQEYWPVKVLKPRRAHEIKVKVYVSMAVMSSFLVAGFLALIQIVATPYFTRQLILRSSFSFNWNESYVYEAIYIWQYFTEFFVLFLVTTFDTLLFGMILVTSVQYILLQSVLSGILCDRSKKQMILIYGENAWNVNEMEILQKCVYQHRLLIKICNQLEDCFTYVILTLFFTSTSALCVSSFIMKLDFTQFFKMSMYTFGHFIQLFCYCYAGNELMYESSKLSEALFSSKWYLSHNVNFWKALVLTVQRAQRGPRLTAAGLVDLNFESFLMILRISFSFYTLLDNVTSNGTSAVAS